MRTLSVPSHRWYENRERELTFPDRWEVDNLTSPGFNKPGLSPDEIKDKIEHPIRGPRLDELARGKSRAVIVFDDMTRPTPVKAVAPFLVDSLHRAGMNKGQIRFIWALGAHGAYDMINARKKLGEEIVEQYPIYNHDPFQNTIRVGRTPTGVEFWCNREVMRCDLKIGIGSIIPHVHVGFGGGAKIMLPGVAGIESINQFHNQLYRDPSRIGLGNFDDNIMRAECDAAGDAVGLDFKVDCLINRRGEIANLYAGPFKETHAAGAEEGKDHYGIPYSTGYDIVVCNAYGKANESAISRHFVRVTLKPGAVGTAVLISDAPEGQVSHYVFRSWGSDYGGRHYEPKAKGTLGSWNIKKLIVLSPHPDRTSLDLFCHADDAIIARTWSEVLALLERDYPKEARIAVIQDATMQYMKSATQP
jgi:nickel-dependent lactate racemase